MTYSEIDKAICDIAKEMVAECKSRLDAIPKDNKTERKALQLEHGMYAFCCNAGLLTSSNRDGCLNTRRIFTERLLSRRLPLNRLNQFYKQLDETEKMRFIAAAQAEIFIKDQWLPEQIPAFLPTNRSVQFPNSPVSFLSAVPTKHRYHSPALRFSSPVSAPVPPTPRQTKVSLRCCIHGC